MSAEVMDVDGLAAYLRIPKWSVYRLAAAGRLPGAKVGRHWRFHKALVDEWLIANGRRNLARMRQDVSRSGLAPGKKR